MKKRKFFSHNTLKKYYQDTQGFLDHIPGTTNVDPLCNIKCLAKSDCVT